MKTVACILLLLFSCCLFAEAFAPPELAWKNLQGGEARLSDHSGDIVVLNFWATWCIPCRKEMPLFVELQNEYRERGVKFIALSTDPPEDRKKVEAFAREFSLNFPVWTGGTPEDQLQFRLGTGLPATAILNRDGEIRFRIIGESSRAMLMQRLDYLLNKDSRKIPEELALPEEITPEHWLEHEAGEEEEHGKHEHTASGGSEVPS